MKKEVVDYETEFLNDCLKTYNKTKKDIMHEDSLSLIYRIMDILEMHEAYDFLIHICEDIENSFQSNSNLVINTKIRKINVLLKQGKMNEAISFCEQWQEDNPHLLATVHELLVVYKQTKKYDLAIDLLHEYIHDYSNCNEENYELFDIASKIYREINDIETLETILNAINQFLDN